MKHEAVAIGEVCKVNPKPDANLSPTQQCSFIPMEYVDDSFGTVTHQAIRSIEQVKTGYTFFKNADVLFAKITPCMENGKCAIARKLTNGIGFGSTEFHVIRPGPLVIPEWVFYFIRQAWVREHAERRMTGSAGQRRVPTNVVEELEIPLPPLPEQQRIAAILEKADRLRRMRQYAQELSEKHLQSVFVKMFSTYLGSDSPKNRLGEDKLVEITGGGTPSREVAKYFEGNIPWLTAKDMRSDYIADTKEHITEEAIKNSATKLVPVGSILLVVKSKVLMHRLPIAIAERAMCHGQDIKSIQCSKKINPLFLAQVLKYNEPKLLAQARGANTEGLTLPMLEAVEVPVAPLPLQEKFALIVRNFEYLRNQQREAARQAEYLFQTLLHRAFRGEL